MLKLMADETPARAEGRTAPVSRILIVESDPLLREILGSGLALHNPRYRTVAVADPAAAYQALAAAELDLILAALDQPRRIDQVRIFERLREVVPHVPVLMLSESGSGDVPDEAACDAILPKPPDMDELLAQADRLLRRSRQSFVRGIGLASLLQVIHLERKTCTLTVTGGASRGRLGLRLGQLVHAKARTGEELLAGREAFFAILGWPNPVMSIDDGCDERAEPANLEGQVEQLLLEFYVNEDHRRR